LPSATTPSNTLSALFAPHEGEAAIVPKPIDSQGPPREAEPRQLVVEKAAPAAPSTLAIVSLVQGLDGEAELLVRQGDRAYGDARYVEAEKLYGKARVLAPRHAAGVVGQARARIGKLALGLELGIAKGNPTVKAQIAELRRAVRLSDDFAPAHYELGRALLLIDDAPGALSSLERSALLLPQHPEVQSTYGVALIASGKSDLAVAAFTRARDLDSGVASRHGNLATALMMMGRTKEAIAEYESAVRLAEGDSRAHSDYGTALLASGELERATRELQRAVVLDPGRAAIHSNLGYALSLRSKNAEATAEYREALRLDPKLISAWINLATVLSRDPATRGEARAALEKAKSLDPTDPRVKANLQELEQLDGKK
jgi:tetratricopeptide (TPR) repeat protein